MIRAIFSQAHGFEDVEAPAALMDDDSAEGWEVRLKNLGYLWQTSQRVGTYGDDGLESAGDYAVYEYGGSDPTLPKYVVDMTTGFEDGYFIGVRTTGDLIALKLKLAQCAHAETVALLRDMSKVVERTFRVYHGHDKYKACAECDPDEYREEQRAKEEARKIRDAERIAFVYFPDNGRMLIEHFKDEATLKAALQTTTRPYDIVLLVRGTRSEWVRMREPFQDALVKDHRLSGVYTVNADMWSYVNRRRREMGMDGYTPTMWERLRSGAE